MLTAIRLVLLITLLIPVFTRCSTVPGLPGAAPQSSEKLHVVSMPGEGFSTEVVGELKPSFISDKEAQGFVGNKDTDEATKARVAAMAKNTRVYEIKNIIGQYNHSCGVAVCDFPMLAEIDSSRVNDLLKAGVDNIATNQKATILSQSYKKVGPYDGVDIEGEVKEKGTHFRSRLVIALDRKRIYECTVSGLKQWIDQPNQRAFTDKFQIIPMEAPGEVMNAKATNYINHFWRAPERNRPLTATAVFTINPDGRVSNFNFKQPSGSKSFDRLAKETIMNCQPFPSPPSAPTDVEYTFQ